MDPGNAALVEIIRREIAQSGAISFARFMELALYHPEHGYYSSGRAALGRHGDYFTNISVGPVYGKLIASQFVDIWESMGQPAEFVVVEQGAHDGEFARDLLQTVSAQRPDFFSILRYRLVEPFPTLRERQRKTLSEFQTRIDWVSTVDDLAPFQGIHWSNELFDALPFHLLTAQPVGGESGDLSWMEKCVALEQDEFVFVNQPITHGVLRERAQALPLRPTGYETEINPDALHLVRSLSSKLTRGYLLAVDYGFTRAEFYDEHRNSGTWQCRAGHRLLDSPFLAIGHADITAHLEWTSLVEGAGAMGFTLAGFTDQHHFLTSLLAADPRFAEEASPKERRALQTLLHPEMLGRSFQVLALARQVETTPALSGFKFARDPRVALGLL